MTKGDFLRALETELNVPSGSLSEDQALAGVPGWDSMAAVQFIALADEKLGAAVSTDQIAKAKTVNELLSSVGDRFAA